MVEYELEGDLLQNITLIVPMPYINGEPLEIKHYNRPYNMTIVETKYVGSLQNSQHNLPSYFLKSITNR